MLKVWARFLGKGKNKIIAAAPPLPPVNTHVEVMNLVLVEL